MDNRVPAPERGVTPCAEAIAVLADGDLGRWRGLPEACARAEVEDVLSLATGEANESGSFSGPMAGPVVYAPTPGAPHGLTVHYGADTVDHITIVRPRFRQPVQDALGEPGGRIRSYLEGSREQWVYPGLGLAFHTSASEPGVNWLYVFAPTRLEVYETSLLSRVRTLRHGRR